MTPDVSSITRRAAAPSSACPFEDSTVTRSHLTPAAYPAARPRRLRRDAFTRALVREHTLTASDLILPVFIHEGENLLQPVASMPGVSRQSLNHLLRTAEQCVELGIPVIALFPVIDAALKTPDGAEALNADG